MIGLRSFPGQWRQEATHCHVAAAVVAASVVGAGATAYGASQAANAQKSAANKASDTQMQMYDQTRKDLLPYNTAGQQSQAALDYGLGIGANDPSLSAGGYGYGDLTRPVKMDQATLEATPGYQFNLSQGLKGVQNSAAARGLGISGAALKGAASYATGLADSTYQNQFNNAVTNQTNAYNRLMGNVGIGENAAAQTGNYGTQTAANIGANTVGAGAAQAGADVAGGNAISNAANGLGNYAFANQFLNPSTASMYQIPSGFGAQTPGIDAAFAAGTTPI